MNSFFYICIFIFSSSSAGLPIYIIISLLYRIFSLVGYEGCTTDLYIYACLRWLSHPKCIVASDTKDIKSLNNNKFNYEMDSKPGSMLHLFQLKH